MGMARLLFAVIFCASSEQRKEINSMLSSLDKKKLRTWTKLSLLPPEKNSS